jgi:ankyrin repeat protein
VSVVDGDGGNGIPLRAAALGGHVDLARCLLGAGANVNKQTVRHSTALHAASIAGHVDMVSSRFFFKSQ